MRPDPTKTHSQPKVPLIAPELWNSFGNAESREDYCRFWLALQCAIIPNAIQGIVVLGEADSGAFSPISKWPEEGEDPERLSEISEHVLAEGCGLLVELNPPAGVARPSTFRYGVAYPINVDNRLQGAVAVEVAAASEEQLQSVMAQLQWGIAWVELFFRRHRAQNDEAALTRLKSAVDILASVLSEKTFKSASMAFVTEMATQLNSDRVSLAFMKKNHARIQAISHSAKIGRRMNLIRAIEMAMDEAIIQRKQVFFPPHPGGETLIVRDHEQLSRQQGAGSILTLPFYGDEKYHGALTIERSREAPFTVAEASFCLSVTALLFPALDNKRQNDRFLITKAWDSLKDQLSLLLGPGHLVRKLLVVVIIGAIGFFSYQTADYRIAANSVLEGAVRRVVVAPFDGYVKESSVRAGDVVAAGAHLCTLDDRDLRLERLNWLSKQTQYQRQYQEALAEHNRAEANIIKAQLKQATARFDLVESQLARTVLVAPFKGILLSGDLTQHLGGAVEKGKILFEVAPLAAYRIILEVDERRIADVKIGQRGDIVLSALPHEHFEFEIEKITPIATAKEGLNYFRVEAKPEKVSKHLRPGMEGVGKIHVDRRKLISIWTRDLREWWRLKLWAWFP